MNASSPVKNNTMTADELIVEALNSGLYDVDLSTGAVINSKGRVLAMPPDEDGYRTFTLYFSPQLQRSVRVHRMVAIKAWGLDAVRDHPVGHLDHNRTHNSISNLWIPASVKEHNEYDGIPKNLIAGQAKCKDAWDPCVRCGDPNGPITPRKKTPARSSGARFGIDGQLCWRCYHALDERQRRAAKKAIV